MSAAKTIRRRFVVDGHHATLAVPIVAGVALGCSIEWDGDRPPRLRGAGLARYRRLRNAVLTTVANEIGAAVVAVDLEPDGTTAMTVIPPDRETRP